MAGSMNFSELQIPRAMAATASALKVKTDLNSICGMAVWKRDGGGDIIYSKPAHHTLSVYQAGGYGVWSNDSASYGFSEAICILPEGMETKWTNSSTVTNLHVYFTQSQLEALNWSKCPDISPLIFGRDKVLKALSRPLIEHLNWAATADSLAIEHLILTLLSRIPAGGAEHRKTLSPISNFYERIEERLRDLQSGPPSLDELATDLDISPRHLTRVYKEHTGVTISQRFRTIQLERVTELMRGDAPLAQIALECGFSSQSHLSTAFRAHFGCPPSRYRPQ